MALPASDDELLLLHHPRCSKSRAARALLEERGVRFAERRYLEEPLDRGELEALRSRLGQPVSAWVRPGEDAWRRAGLGASAADTPETALLDAIAAHPALLQRPILVRGGRAVVGRPPEKVLDLL